jgi:hypothetical protein
MRFSVERSTKMRIALCAAVVMLGTALLNIRSERAPIEAARVSATPALELKPAPPTPMAKEKARLGDDANWLPQWDAVIEEAIPDGLLSSNVPRDVKQFCPRFDSLRDVDKRVYWAYFFQALSGAEAGLDPTSNVQHTEPEVAVKDRVSHRMVRSEGLLQLTYQDAERYGCDFDWENDKYLDEHDPAKTILQPANNLLCGVKILKFQLVNQRKPLLSKTSYWSPLRPGWPGFQTFLKQMSNVPKACGRVRESIETTSVSGGLGAAD